MDAIHHEGCFVLCEQALDKALNVSLNTGIAYAVMAAGTGRNHVTTAWSAEAVAKYSGMNWRRAKEAIEKLRSVRLITKVEGSRARPRYRLRKPRKQLWIPTTFIVGARGETPPIARVRQMQDTKTAFLALALYGEQNLIEHGGISRNLIWREYERDHLVGWAECELYGFTCRDGMTCRPGRGPIPSKDPWDHLRPLIDVGIIELVPYLSEGDDGELIHALAGDALAAEVGSELADFTEEVQTRFSRGNDCDWIIPVRRHMASVTMIDVARMRYRPPKTRMTRIWRSNHVAQLESYLKFYEAKNAAMTGVAA
ncbi:hypothetical protein [Spiribacter insolitus]|uniref:Uncharacterized protein n=1 Tax=Spiribacter insolitus TaxID=3122417 RepID=A0ABV3T478_9GAMM